MINYSLSRRLGLLHHANTGGKHTFILSTSPLVWIFFFFYSTVVFPPQVAPRLQRIVTCHHYTSQRFISIPLLTCRSHIVETRFLIKWPPGDLSRWKKKTSGTNNYVHSSCLYHIQSAESIDLQPSDWLTLWYCCT